MLEWQPTEGAGSCLVLTALQPDGEYTELGSTEKPSYQATGLEGGPPYYFVVRAVRGEERSADSAVAEAQN